MSSNRFTRALQGKSEEILNAGKQEQSNEVKTIIEYKEMEKYGNNEYYSYLKIPVDSSKNGDKFKANFSVEEEIMQKIKKIYGMEGLNNRQYSQIAEKAIDILYDICFILKKEEISVFRDKLTAEEIIKKIKEIEI